MTLRFGDRRRAAVLLHMSSVRDPLGRGGRAIVDWLAEAGFSLWQFLPVGPTGPDGSPYWARSDAAGNPAFIDQTELPARGGDEERAFCTAAASWLEDFACFEVLSAVHGGVPWWEWPVPLRDREPAALAVFRGKHGDALAQVRYTQFCFDWQWRRLHAYARQRGVSFFGDLPFYVAPESFETWSQRAQFQLDAAGRARAVGGVPPDYFSELGQLWGNPLYDWDVMRRDGFAFWRTRVGHQLARVDLLRLDHFRALAAHWAVPAGAQDARGGHWQRTPGWALLRRLRAELGELPLVAEDLGVITPDVEDLRFGFDLPGMRVVQFAFDGASDNPHLPHMHTRHSVVYSGTHDNDTTLGWYRGLDAGTARRVDFVLGAEPGAMPATMIRTVLASVARVAVLPMQDVLALDSRARFNTPGTTVGNWSWQLPEGALTRELARHFRALNSTYGRAR
ncbi:MAG TPA: 4-alpha-glucanotransferase [Steroidobacteraceae bacterium]|nr:4-alpha-glucanotransferase [Steroidobacteraceae bacterium]